MDSAKMLSAFDLEALRDAFKDAVREQNVPASDWAEFAKEFLQHKVVGQEPRGEPCGATQATISGPPGPCLRAIGAISASSTHALARDTVLVAVELAAPRQLPDTSSLHRTN